MSAPALVFWVDLFGAQAGDEQRFEITGPDGNVLHRDDEALPSSNVSWFAFSGRRAPTGGWKPGPYVGRYKFIRAGKMVVEITRTITLQ